MREGANSHNLSQVSHVRFDTAVQSGSCSLAVSSTAYAGADAPSLPVDAGPAIMHAAIRHAGQFATNVHPVCSHMAHPLASNRIL